MKKCPACNRTYSDETLSFCLADGALLSAPYNTEETQSPNVTLNSDEMETKIATVDLSEPLKDHPVPWYIYLLGFVISFIIYSNLQTFIPQSLYSFFIESFSKIIKMLGEPPGTFQLAEMATRILLHLVFFGILGSLFGYIWSEARWKWGLIIVIPALIKGASLSISYRDAPSIYFLGYIVGETGVLIITVFIACLSSNLGSRLSRRTSKKLTP